MLYRCGFKVLNHASVVLLGIVARVAYGEVEVDAVALVFSSRGSIKGEGCLSALVMITATGSSSSASTAICAL